MTDGQDHMDPHAITIPSYTAQESDLIHNSLMSLRKEKIQYLLARLLPFLYSLASTNQAASMV